MTHVDKASKFLVTDLDRNKAAAQIHQVTIGLFSEIPQEQRLTMNFDKVKPEALEKAVALINHRPRKSLDYRMPYEVLLTCCIQNI